MAVFPAELGSLHAARLFAGQVLDRSGRDLSGGARADVLLAVGELAANAVVHARSRFAVALAFTAGTVLVEVTDSGPGLPARRESTVNDPGGRGLMLVAAVADRWGVRQSPGMKTVWCAIPAGPDT